MMNTLIGKTESMSSIKSIEDSPIAHALFNEVRWAWLWLIFRIYIGWHCLESGWGKLPDGGASTVGCFQHSVRLGGLAISPMMLIIEEAARSH